jgi:rod shape-determining protein MreB
MFSAVLGFFSQDLAVDLGTCETRIHQRGSGLVLREPSVVAVHTDRQGRRRVAAVGTSARAMRGRTPRDLVAVEPVRQGHVVEYDVAEALLAHLVRQVHRRNALLAPTLVLAVPHDASDMERRALREACETAGARAVHLVDRPLAAALGADLPIHRPSGHLLVDLGGGEVAISLVSLSGVVSHQVVPWGGRTIDAQLAAAVLDRHELAIGDDTAERLKVELFDARLRGGRTARIAGRCHRRGVPRAVDVDSGDVADVAERFVAALVRGVRAVLDHAPSELAADVADRGVVLCGAGARIRGLEGALRDRTGLPVVRADRAEDVVIFGAGRVLDDLDVREAIAC